MSQSTSTSPHGRNAQLAFDISSVLQCHRHDRRTQRTIQHKLVRREGIMDADTAPHSDDASGIVFIFPQARREHSDH